jgi:hypothetical protein
VTVETAPAEAVMAQAEAAKVEALMAVAGQNTASNLGNFPNRTLQPSLG